MKLKNNKKNTIFSHCVKPLTLILVPVVLSCLICCSNHYEGGSVTSILDAADSCILAGNSSGAYNALKQAEKQSSTSYERLGVYKRYLRIGDYSKAEKTIKNAIKKDSENLGLTAIYGDLLLRQNKIKQSLKISKKLSGTKFGSVYAEAFLKNTIDSEKSANELFGGRATKEDKEWKKDESRKNEVFYDSRFSSIYRDAYLGTKKYRWNWNAAALCMRDGKYAEGAELYPNRTENMDDALFWGLVLFDNGLYIKSLEAMDGHEKENFNPATVMQFKALLADDYYILSMDDEAEKIRSELLVMDPSVSKIASQKFLPQTYVNSAIYARGQENQVQEYQRLKDVVDLFPSYTPGLASYGEFAIRRQNRPEDDMMTAHIRASGLATREMEEDGKIPNIKISEVLSLIEQANEKDPNPELQVLKQQLIMESDLGMEKAKKASLIWPLLEKNEIASSLYPSEIMRFSMITLLDAGQDDEAQELFERYEHAAHTDPELLAKKKKVKKFVPIEHLEELELWECEMVAWFAIKDEKFDDAKKIYDYIVKIYSNRSPVARASGQNQAVINSCVNVANVYASDKLHAQSLDYLSKANSRAADPKTKADILYRMGKQSLYLGDKSSASRSFKYSLTLDPNSNKTRFMLQQVEK